MGLTQVIRHAGAVVDHSVIGQSITGRQVAARSVVVVSKDAGIRERLRQGLEGMRWTVYEATGGADATEQADQIRPEALLVDTWLCDLDVAEFTSGMSSHYPAMEVLGLDGNLSRGTSAARSPRRNELLHAIRLAQEPIAASCVLATPEQVRPLASSGASVADFPLSQSRKVEPLPELIGRSASIVELTRMIRLVAQTSATVLIEGETGTGKEVVAKALHRLSLRSAKPFTVLNCAAIPESLLEAELFGHTRGAFTGAVQARMGRIESADGGTLFLDEIGEMPLALQAKMLRFLECGELQRVGENEIIRVKVRVIAATHQDLERRAELGTFRLDLYHRLAVFPLEVSPLRERLEDLPLLTDFFLGLMGREAPRKTLSAAALNKMATHVWPGNVRELLHVLERGAILAEARQEISAEDVHWRRRQR